MLKLVFVCTCGKIVDIIYLDSDNDEVITKFELCGECYDHNNGGVRCTLQLSVGYVESRFSLD